MKKIFCLILVLCLLTGCGKVLDDYTYVGITDDLGYEVLSPKNPKRVAVLFSSYAQAWKSVGGSVDITVQESIDRGFCDEDVIVVDTKSGHSHIDTELLIASKPDLVIGTADYEVQRQVAQLCRDAGIPVALFKVETFADYANMLSRCAAITGNHDSYIENSQHVKDEINSLFKVISVTESKGELEVGKKILFIRAGSSERSTKAKTKAENFVCTMLDELRTDNIAQNAPTLLETLSIEEIIKEDPEHIFVSTMGDENAAKGYVTSLFEEDGWSLLTAVKNGNVHFLPKDLFHYKPNDRWAEAYRYLAAILYPELINK